VRIIAATHRDLESAIGDGQFREDLFYRLNVFPVQMPPLRDRLEDLPVLIEFLVERQMRGGGKGIRFAPDALACLSRNFWPGNVRELANLLERLAILFPGKLIGAADLPPTYRGQPAAASVVAGKWLLSEERAERAVAAIAEVAPRPDESEKSLPRGGLDLKDHLCAIEVGLIRQALDEADGTVAEAARLLRMRRTTLVEKLRKYRMTA
jgi:sigma-54 specific flagellar transcriptional regulator A